MGEQVIADQLGALCFAQKKDFLLWKSFFVMWISSCTVRLKEGDEVRIACYMLGANLAAD